MNEPAYTDAFAIQEVTTRYVCGVCKVLVKSKDKTVSECKNGHTNRIVRA